MSAGTALLGNMASHSQCKNLVEFKAGKMTMAGKMVQPDKRKGLVYIYQSEDRLMHFCWKDRTQGYIEDDLIIFPYDFEFKKVPQCTTGRVYVLKFKSSNQKKFFWIQEARTDKDEYNCRKVNQVLNYPPVQWYPKKSTEGKQTTILSQAELMRMFGDVEPIGGHAVNCGKSMSEIGGSPPSTPTISRHIPDSDLLRAVDQSDTAPSTPSGNDIPSTPTPSATITAPKEVNPFDTTITKESLRVMLNNPKIAQELQKHIKMEPGGFEYAIPSTLACPKFQEMVSMFCSAMQTESMGAVTAANLSNMEDFVWALLTAYYVTPDSDEEVMNKENSIKDDKDDLNLD